MLTPHQNYTLNRLFDVNQSREWQGGKEEKEEDQWTEYFFFVIFSSNIHFDVAKWKTYITWNNTIRRNLLSWPQSNLADVPEEKWLKKVEQA